MRSSTESRRFQMRHRAHRWNLRLGFGSKRFFSRPVRVSAGLVRYVEADEIVPGGEELAVGGAGFAIAERVAVAFDDGECADRGAGEECFVGHAEFVDGDGP